MWYQQTKSGSWQFFERYTDVMTGRHRTISVTLDKNTRSSRKAAQSALAAKIEEQRREVGQFANMTLEELLHLYLQRGGIRESTRMRDQALANVINPMLGKDTKINSLSASYIKRKMVAAGKDGNRELLGRIKSLMRWGYRNDYIDDVAWIDKLQKSRKAKEDIKEKYMEESEIRILLDGMKIPEWRDLTEFLVLSGLRIGEAMDLKRSSIKDNVIEVRSTLGLLTNKTGPTKTDAGSRDVTITPQLRQCIRRIRKRSISSIYFLAGPGGRMIDYPAYRKYLAENSERLLGRRIRPHALRHTYTSLMAAAGVPLDVISRQLGHEDSSVTRQVYFHITEKLKERDASIIRNVRLIQ